MKTKITKRMASSITTTTSNPINKKYLEYCEDIKASFKQCTYYMKRKKKTCTRRVNDFNTQFCSLHTPEGLARERKKGEETRKVYNKLVDKTCEEYLKETYGITVYQEQVMLLSQKLADFTKGEWEHANKKDNRGKCKDCCNFPLTVAAKSHDFCAQMQLSANSLSKKQRFLFSNTTFS